MKNSLKHYVVRVDPETFEWLTEPIFTGVVSRSEFESRRDENSRHYVTRERDGEICAFTLDFRKGGCF